MVDDFDGDAAGLGFGEGARGVTVERSPGLLVGLSFQSGLERVVWIICTEKIGVPDKETLFVVICVDEPAGDTICVVAAHFSTIGVENIHTVDLYPDLAVFGGEDRDIRLAEDHEEVAFA